MPISPRNWQTVNASTKGTSGNSAETSKRNGATRTTFILKSNGARKNAKSRGCPRDLEFCRIQQWLNRNQSWRSNRLTRTPVTRREIDSVWENECGKEARNRS